MSRTPTPLVPMAQAMLVRMYKYVGLVALVGILLGLIFYVTVNAFYWFDRTWVRPVVLSASHDKVVEARSTLEREKSRRDELVAKRRQTELELAHLQRSVEAHQVFEQELGAVIAADSKDLDVAMARRERARASLERKVAQDQLMAVRENISMIEKAIAGADLLIDQIESSPYIAATRKQVPVVFAPHDHVDNVSPGVPLYECTLGLIWCKNVGQVVKLMDEEVTNYHPNDDSIERGILVQVELFDESSAASDVLFVGRRPFWIF